MDVEVNRRVTIIFDVQMKASSCWLEYCALWEASRRERAFALPFCVEKKAFRYPFMCVLVPMEHLTVLSSLLVDNISTSPPSFAAQHDSVAVIFLGEEWFHGSGQGSWPCFPVPVHGSPFVCISVREYICVLGFALPHLPPVVVQALLVNSLTLPWAVLGTSEHGFYGTLVSFLCRIASLLEKERCEDQGMSIFLLLGIMAHVAT